MPDTPGEAAVRDALRESASKNRMEVALASETVDLLRSEIRLAVADGLSDGLKKALSEENAELIFKAFFSAMQKQAAVRTGSFVLGGLDDLARKAVWVVFTLAVLYNFGGWLAVKAGWAALQSHSGGAP